MYRSSLARQTLFGMLGSARASRAGDGALAIANFSLLRALRRGAAMSTRGRVRFPGMQAASRERSRSFLNQFPCITQMLFRGENIAESQTNHGLAAQFCLIQIRAT